MNHRGATLSTIAVLTFLVCVLVAAIVREPIPRTHDEFSYRLLGETFARGRASNAAPANPEFFDTFHVLLRPVYVSKYFPAQGIFLAFGQIVTGHQSVGIWLSSAVACAAVTWMLEAWVGWEWALLGGILIVLQYGVFSYWSQTFWGGMVPGLGGALFFGAIHRLWNEFSWQNSFLLGLGLVVLASSRPLEGLLAVLPAIALFINDSRKRRRWKDPEFCLKVVLPAFLLLACGVFGLAAYNRAITGSVLKTPYQLNEEQYQESPPFIFMPLRPKLTYSSPVVQSYYEVNEMRAYLTPRVPKWFLTEGARKLATWWDFYAGFILTGPLVLPGLLKKGRIRWLQAAVLIALIALSFFLDLKAVFVCGIIDLLVAVQVVLLWYVFDDKWSRLAIVSCALVEFELLFAKWEFPHYFAPAACLVWFLETEGLRKIWNWNSQEGNSEWDVTRSRSRRAKRRSPAAKRKGLSWRWLIYAVPIACGFSLIWRIGERLNGSLYDPHGIVRQALVLDDWSVDRAKIDQRLDEQPTPQLVFVRYSPLHNINFEWVYNHPDIMHSKVIWARDLGVEHNRDLLKLLPGRTVWLIEADRPHPQLIPYSTVDAEYSESNASPSTEAVEQSNFSQ